MRAGRFQIAVGTASPSASASFGHRIVVVCVRRLVLYPNLAVGSATIDELPEWEVVQATLSESIFGTRTRAAGADNEVEALEKSFKAIKLSHKIEHLDALMKDVHAAAIELAMTVASLPGGTDVPCGLLSRGSSSSDDGSDGKVRFNTGPALLGSFRSSAAEALPQVAFNGSPGSERASPTLELPDGSEVELHVPREGPAVAESSTKSRMSLIMLTSDETQISDFHELAESTRTQ
jgi:hypothetical protein